MLGIDPRVLRIAWTVFLFGLILFVIYKIGHALVLFALALFLAHLLSPLVELLERVTPPSFSRTAVIAIVYLALVGAVLAIAIPVGSSIADQAANLATKVPEAIKQDPLGGLPLPRALEPLRPRVTDFLRERLQQINQDVLPVLSSAGKQILTGIGTILGVVLVPILSFFFLKDGPAMRLAIIERFDPAKRATVTSLLADLHLLLVQYIRALFFLSMATFIAVFSFLSIVGMQYAILLAGVAALLEFVPVAGPLTAAAVILLVAAFSGFKHVLWILVFLAIYRVFQDYVLSPFLMSAGVEVHPLLVLFGVIAGEQLAGIPGMFFSVPVIAVLRVVLRRVGPRRL